MSKDRLPIRPRLRKPPLRIADILRWADDFHAKHGRWPHMNDGVVEGTADQTWAAADQALRGGNRGLPAGSSLAKLFLKCRGRRHWHLPPDLTIEQILGWADAHHERTGDWPSGHSTKQIPKAPKGMTWVAVDIALSRGKRGLPGGLTLAKVLIVRPSQNLFQSQIGHCHPVSHATMLLHQHRTGYWPQYQDGKIAAAPQETWNAVDTALSKGKRGLPGGDSLSRLLARRRGVRNKSALPRLDEPANCRWAKAHRNRTGTWPVVRSGPVLDAPGETWSGINAAFDRGMRGLPGVEADDPHPFAYIRLSYNRLHPPATNQIPSESNRTSPGRISESFGTGQHSLHREM